MPEGEGATSDFDLAELLETFAGAGADGPLSDLLEIDVSRARIRLVDGRRGVTLAANDVSAALLRTTDGLAFEGSGTLAWESGARTPLDIHRSEEHTSELQSLMRISYAVFCLKKKKTQRPQACN